jgi:dienelactone hydrolase
MNPIDAAQIRSLETRIFSDQERLTLSRMLREGVDRRCDAVNQCDIEAWAEIDSKKEWKDFCAERIEALRRSLGDFPPVPEEVETKVTGAIEGDGFRIENVLYESRPGIFVAANLYLPSPLRDRMPSIILVHSHHNPKIQGELQDMGMLWARSGCMVLVMDEFCYGDRRDHAPGPRQDYWFRHVSGLQLHVIGESLMGWMVWDIMRGVDELLSREGADSDKVIVMGSVAGGGDPAAVAAALDPRIACAVPFNFGGPQPETPYPFPDDAVRSFNYLGSAGWESTRNLRLSGMDGFLPWVIVGSIAPRRLIYAHEFSWDTERDPVWKRLQKIYGFYNAERNLDFTHGTGLLTGRPPEASHCNNIGPVHRERIYAGLEEWFGIEPPEREVEERLPDDALVCLSSEVRTELDLRPVHEILTEIGVERSATFRSSLAGLSPDKQRERLREAWSVLLGDVEPVGEFNVKSRNSSSLGDIAFERIVLEVEPDILVPMLLLLPGEDQGGCPIVIGLSQDGKEKFLEESAEEIAALLTQGVAVCLPDVRGTGETRPDSSRQPRTEATAISAAELMLGRTLLGSRLRDVRSVLAYLREEMGGTRFALWGDSFAPTNPVGFCDPLIGEDDPPAQSEPLGGLLALFGALFEDDVFAVSARGMLTGYASLLDDVFCYVPHDAVVPGALTAGDLCDVAAALAPRPLRMEGLVDGRNCAAPEKAVNALFEPVIRAYAKVPDRLVLALEAGDDIASWLVASPISEL